MRAPLYSQQADELMLPSAIESPQAIYARLRAKNPISRIGDSGVHMLTSWALIEEALGREEDFSANLTGVLFRGDDGEPSLFDISGAGANQVIATADEPDHGVHRAISQPRLDQRRIFPMEERLRGWVREAFAPVLASGGGDVVPLSERIPALAVAFLLGLPEEDVSHFRVWAMMGGDMLAGEVDSERLGFLGRTTGEMANYLGEHFDRAKAAPNHDVDAPLMHALALGVEAGRIDRQEAIGIAIVMFGAGGESTAALIGSTLKVLAERPELASELRADPSLIPRYIEEVVRLESPFNFHYRAVKRTCELGGYELNEGDRLMLIWAAANRDPAVHEAPDELRLDRKHPKNHMGFGRGAHFCIGAPLARLEARVVLEELLLNSQKIERRDYAYAKSIFIRRLERLDLTIA